MTGNNAPAGPRYGGLTGRRLKDHEKRLPVGECTLPLVIETPEPRDPESLNDFLSLYSGKIKEDAARHGAVLLRGFTISSAQEFEKAMLSIQGFRPMGQQFMHDVGRISVRGATHVLSTHAINPTGGAFSIGSWHTEGFHHPDVPRYQIFHCARPPWLGGETGLASMAGVYESLPESTRQKLSKSAVVTSAWPLQVVAHRYQISLEQAEVFCSEAGLGVNVSPSGKNVVLTKSTVLRQSESGTCSLSGNFGQAMPGLRRKTWKLFLPLYDGWQWSLHRLAWRKGPKVRFLLNMIASTLWSALAHPLVAIRYFGSLAEQRESRKLKLGDQFCRLPDLLAPEDVEALARAIWRHSVIFTWKRGDILIIDNTQVAHCGMPGLGPRVLNVMMCNPLPLNHPISSGLVDVDENANPIESVSLRIARFLEKRD